MEKRNLKLAAMSMLTIGASLLLMNVGRLDGYVSDWVVRVIGITVMLCTGLSVFFTVRELAKVSSKAKETEEQTEEKE